MIIPEIIRECKTVLEAHHGPRFKGLVLYGSVARGQDSSVSDIDLLVLLSQPFNYFEELRRIVELLYPIQLESDRLISAKPVPSDEFARGRLQGNVVDKAKATRAIIREMDPDGRVLWETFWVLNRKPIDCF